MNDSHLNCWLEDLGQRQRIRILRDSQRFQVVRQCVGSQKMARAAFAQNLTAKTIWQMARKQTGCPGYKTIRVRACCLKLPAPLLGRHRNNAGV